MERKDLTSWRGLLERIVIGRGPQEYASMHLNTKASPDEVDINRSDGSLHTVSIGGGGDYDISTSSDTISMRFLQLIYGDISNIDVYDPDSRDGPLCGYLSPLVYSYLLDMVPLYLPPSCVMLNLDLDWLSPIEGIDCFYSYGPPLVHAPIQTEAEPADHRFENRMLTSTSQKFQAHITWQLGAQSIGGTPAPIHELLVYG
ncbi:hypothetical protein HAX54_021244, partial [Datura stramonium]|nr:hypothetical protein [Datura stramonium]